MAVQGGADGADDYRDIRQKERLWLAAVYSVQGKDSFLEHRNADYIHVHSGCSCIAIASQRNPSKCKLVIKHSEPLYNVL